MTRQRLVSCCVIPAVLAAVALAAVPLVAQTAGPSSKSAVHRNRVRRRGRHPRTPWGDPDLQGVWTERLGGGIPRRAAPAKIRRQRPMSEDEEFNGRLETRWSTSHTSAAENAVGSFRGDGAWLNKSFSQTSLIVDPADGKIPPLTPEAEKRRAPRDRGTVRRRPVRQPEDFTLYDRCITRGIVGSVLPVVYGNGNRILQTPRQVVISYEMVHDTRVIPLDGRPHIGSKIRQYLGDARGHWEGNTLVVETTNLTDQTSIGANGNGLRHSAR